MEYHKYDIHLAIIYFEEINQFKTRPILIYEEKGKYELYDIYKITSKNNGYKYNYKIKRWKEAGLNEESYIKLANIKSIHSSYIRDKIGELQQEDIIGMEELIKIYNEDIEKASKKYDEHFTSSIEIPDEVLKKLENNEETEEENNEDEQEENTSYLTR